MPIMIQLESMSNTSVSVNASTIKEIEPYENGSLIVFVNSATLAVKEKPKIINVLIENAIDNFWSRK